MNEERNDLPRESVIHFFARALELGYVSAFQIPGLLQDWYNAKRGGDLRSLVAYAIAEGFLSMRQVTRLLNAIRLGEPAAAAA